MADNTSNRGFASMDEDTQRKIASQGGKASPTKFEAGSSRARNAGKKGAEAQPTEAKRRGGENSHRND
ncbi:MAG TPA: KGG domain-containing protein [Nevskiaceae bacterium]|nr:KGG domain-containing protein [Nevskiaceae bacterium]